ncbi:M56 family metallopeptidase [Aestuariibius sp. HNIBRBA575]|uniref:M56 family metallopeptidase n=1 Tax=Aestuariibius sp. HNIBRBA575 TaxID=3233343 RepID=UPI0034A278A0
MIIESLLSVYLDVNIVLIFAAVIWFGTKHLLAKSRLKHAFLAQLQMLYAVLLTVALTPVILFGFETLRQSGLLGSTTAFNLSDFVVSQYLNGNIALAPTQFQKLLMLRSELTQDIITMSTLLAQMIVGVGVLGFGYCMAKTLFNACKISRLISRAYVLRRHGHVDVRVTHEIGVPFSTRGLWRHYVVLPTTILAQSNDARVAVSHELQHVRQRDLAWEIILETLRPVFFWNPAFSLMKREVEKFRELACDQQVLSHKPFSVKEYCDCLLRVCRASLGHRRNQLMSHSVPFAHLDQSTRGHGSKSFLKRRVLSMLALTRNPGGAVTLVLMLSVMVSVTTMTIIAQPASGWSQDRLMLSTIVNLERLEMRNSSGN